MALLPKLPDDVKDENQLLEYLRGISLVLDDKSNQADGFDGDITSADSRITTLEEAVANYQQYQSYINYSPYYVQSSSPSSPYIGWLWYDTDDNKLYKYSGTNWIEINWQEIVKATPEWQAGYLQINGSTGMLKIADGQTTPTWRDCYPLVGADTIYIVDATKYYFLIKKCVINANALRIVFTPKMVSYFRIYREPYSGDRELTISGIAGSGTRFGHYAITTTGHGMENYSITKHLIASNSNNLSVFNIVLRGAMSYAVTNEYFNDGSRYGIYHYSAHLSIATTSYYLGTLNSTAKLIIEKVGVYAI